MFIKVSTLSSFTIRSSQSSLHLHSSVRHSRHVRPSLLSPRSRDHALPAARRQSGCSHHVGLRRLDPIVLHRRQRARAPTFAPAPTVPRRRCGSCCGSLGWSGKADGGRAVPPPAGRGPTAGKVIVSANCLATLTIVNVYAKKGRIRRRGRQSPRSLALEQKLETDKPCSDPGQCKHSEGRSV